MLEQQAQYADRVRGEMLALWGVAEAQALGVLELLSSAEGNPVTRSVPYDEVVPAEVAEQRVRDLGQSVPGVPAVLDLSHPRACEALATGAADLGVAVQRGVSKVVVTAGAEPSVAFRLGDEERRVRCRLVVGADGRSSRVRRQVGIDWQSTPHRTFGWGLLVDGVEHWPSDAMSIGTHDGVVFFVLPRANGRVRLYLLHSADEPPRFAGADAARAFLDTFGRISCVPQCEAFAAATPVGPCAGFPMHDTWTDEPYVPGVALIGDAAGYNDPIIGQGLSIALRDARDLAAALTSTDDWSSSTLSGYGAVRAERMRRLRATAEAYTRLRADFSDQGRLRRAAALRRFATEPEALLPIAAALVGRRSATARLRPGIRRPDARRGRVGSLQRVGRRSSGPVGVEQQALR